MKRWFIALLTLSLVLRASAEQLEWLTDVPAALKKAKAENKTVLLDFTGSDWCGWCIKLKAEVFDQPQFAAFAKANLVLVELDYPRTKPQSAALKQANDALSKKYEVTGFPTVILLSGDGEQLDKTVGYLSRGLSAYMAKFEQVRHGGTTAADAPPEPPRHAPVYVPLPQVAPVQYDDLALKGISIGPSGHLAMINNETLAVGESASVKVKDGHVQIVCKEIREDSVIVTVDGKTVELKMRP